MRKKTSPIFSRFKWFKYTYKKRVGMIWCEKECKLVCWFNWQIINDGILLKAKRTWRSTRLGWQVASHKCSLFARSRISGHGSGSWGKTISEPISGGFLRPTEISNGSMRGKQVLQKIDPKSTHAQEKQAQFQFIRVKTETGTLSIHYVNTDRVADDIFTKPLPVKKAVTLRRVFDGNRLFATS